MIRGMKISVILSHPTKGSFNHALADAACAAAREAGAEAILHDLHAEGFDPVYGADEARRDAVLPPAIASHVEELGQADGLVLVHPNYWSRPPAMMCGWVDRAIRPGRAYRFVPDGKGGARPEGLLKLKFALVINTSNTPPEIERNALGDPLEVHWKKVVFGLVGVPKVERRNYGPVIVSTADMRAQWLAETRELAGRLTMESR